MSKRQSKSGLITIITIVFNDHLNIQQTIDSVKNQTYKEIQYIVIDGGSTDGTKEIIYRNKDYIDKIISEEDNGIYDALNKGISYAKGEIVGFLHSGDFYVSEDVVQLIANEFDNTGSDSVFSDLDIVDELDTTKIIRHFSGKNFNLLKLRMGLMPPHPTFYCKLKLYNIAGEYSTDYEVSSDYEMMVRLFYTKRISYSYINTTTIKMRDGGTSNSGFFNQIKQNIEKYEAARNNNFYTNYFLIACKIPFKIGEYIFRS